MEYKSDTIFNLQKYRETSYATAKMNQESKIKMSQFQISIHCNQFLNCLIYSGDDVKKLYRKLKLRRTVAFKIVVITDFQSFVTYRS